MAPPRERILLVEHDLETSDLIARQTLQPLGYRLEIVASASQAIQEAVRFSPDVIIVNLKLPGLSGKDLLVALSSQGVDVPIIVIAEKGMETDVIQAFRLGASDYLRWPVREAEVVSAVERVLKQVRNKNERETLARQLKQTNQELQRRVRELTTIFAIGKAVTSVTDTRALLDKIVEGAVYITEADRGWLLLREDRGKEFILSACRNLPESTSRKINQVWDDGISSLVALSGETLSIHGEPLKRFKVAQLGQSAMVVPVKIKKEVIALLVVMRKTALPFGPSNQALLEAVADYASISLVNARLFKALEDRASSSQQVAANALINEQIFFDIYHKTGQGLQASLEAALSQVNLLLGEQRRNLNIEQSKALRVAQENLKDIYALLKVITELPRPDLKRQLSLANLNDLARESISNFQMIARQSTVSIVTEFSSGPVLAKVNSFQISRVIEGLLANALQCSPPGSQVLLRIDQVKENLPHISIKDAGSGYTKEAQALIFDPSYQAEGATRLRNIGPGIRLALIYEIIKAHNGKIWVESEPGKGTVFHVTFPSLPESR